jgi:hypothetical protein
MSASGNGSHDPDKAERKRRVAQLEVEFAKAVERSEQAKRQARLYLVLAIIAMLIFIGAIVLLPK